ncbi:MAG: hypothetical protein ACXWWI_03955 [Nitrospira sp.]
MRCRVCGGHMQRETTDAVMETVEQILDAVDGASELSVVKYAA